MGSIEKLNNYENVISKKVLYMYNLHTCHRKNIGFYRQLNKKLEAYSF